MQGSVPWYEVPCACTGNVSCESRWWRPRFFMLLDLLPCVRGRACRLGAYKSSSSSRLRRMSTTARGAGCGCCLGGLRAPWIGFYSLLVNDKLRLLPRPESGSSAAVIRFP
eukprot:5150100-Prymnesium_polylepis.2